MKKRKAITDTDRIRFIEGCCSIDVCRWQGGKGYRAVVRVYEYDGSDCDDYEEKGLTVRAAIDKAIRERDRRKAGA